MRLTADLHVHTVASGHAFSTIMEVAREAASKGLEVVGLTDHGPALPAGAHPFHFWNLRVVPEELEGVRLLRGIEANIINDEGEFDLDRELLKSLDLVLATFHNHCGYEPGDRDKNTAVLLKAVASPYIDILAHPGSDYFPLHLDEVVEAAKRYGVAVELNNSSLLDTTSRPGAYERDLELAHLAADLGLQIVISSDAHIATDVGKFEAAVELVAETGITPDQIINTSARRVMDFLKERRA